MTKFMLTLAVVGALGCWLAYLACLALAVGCVRALWSERAVDTWNGIERRLGMPAGETSEWGARAMFATLGSGALYLGIMGVATMIQTTREIYSLLASP